MKIQPTLLAAIIAAGITQAAMAQFEASAQAATIAFTGKYQIPGYVETVDGERTYTTDFFKETLNSNDLPTKQEDGYKMNAQSYKVGNKEILSLALSELGEDVSPIGWSIVYKDGALKATKRNEDDITIDIDVSAFAELEAFTASELTTTTTKYNSDGEATDTQTYTGSGTIEGPVTITYGDSEMVGYVTGSYKASKVWYSDPTDKSTAEYINIPGAVKIIGLSGSQEGDTGLEVFTGSVNLAAAKAVPVLQ
jgi:hypothetical protein